MLSLFDGTSTKPRLVEFHVVREHSVSPLIIFSVLLVGVQREDGSGESWNFTGYHYDVPVKGHFSTKTRRGWVEIQE
jgi:hypothetical protein